MAAKCPPAKPAPKAAPRPESESYSYNFKSRNNLLRGRPAKASK